MYRMVEAPHRESDRPASMLGVKSEPRSGVRRTQVRRSGVHGRGVFAMCSVAAGERILQYTGEIISWEEALRRHPHDPAQPTHTFYFHIDDAHVIDGKHGGNSSRWINHSCEPNCDSEIVGQRVFIRALRDLRPGEELSFDYRLTIEGRRTQRLERDYACHCGSANCRGTMLAPRRRASARG
jgi:SET domain-containing protein